MSKVLNLDNVCAFCSRNLHHEGACLSESAAWQSLGLRFTKTGLLLQPPEPLDAHGRARAANSQQPQEVSRRRQAAKTII